MPYLSLFFCLVNGHSTHMGTLREVPIILAKAGELGVVRVLILTPAHNLVSPVQARTVILTA